MIKNQPYNRENEKDKLLKLSFGKLRQEAKKLLVPLYSRESKEVLVELILKYQNKDLIEDLKTNEREFYVDENWKINAEDPKNKISDNEKNNLEDPKNKISNAELELKRLLYKSFPGKKITVTNNKNGSQTILII